MSFCAGCRRTCKRFCADSHIPPEDADDLVQQALLQFVRKRSQIQSPELWLRGAVKNECKMYWRGRSRKLTVAVDQAVLDVMAGGTADDPERAILRRGLARWVKSLPWNCRSLLKFRYGMELDVREVAHRTGYSPASVDKVTKRCLNALSKKLAAAAVSRKLVS